MDEDVSKTAVRNSHNVQLYPCPSYDYLAELFSLTSRSSSTNASYIPKESACKTVDSESRRSHMMENVQNGRFNGELKYQQSPGVRISKDEVACAIISDESERHYKGSQECRRQILKY